MGEPAALPAFQVMVKSTPLETVVGAPVPEAAARWATPDPSLILHPVPDPLTQLATTKGEGSNDPMEMLCGEIAARSALTETSKASKGTMKDTCMSVEVSDPAGTTLVLSALNLGPGDA
jgi:hypothetical protein